MAKAHAADHIGSARRHYATGYRMAWAENRKSLDDYLARRASNPEHYAAFEDGWLDSLEDC